MCSRNPFGFGLKANILGKRTGRVCNHRGDVERRNRRNPDLSTQQTNILVAGLESRLWMQSRVRLFQGEGYINSAHRTSTLNALNTLNTDKHCSKTGKPNEICSLPVFVSAGHRLRHRNEVMRSQFCPDSVDP